MTSPKLVRDELERCEEVVDKEFYVIDTLSIVDYLDGECVPCEIAVIKCSIRGGILGLYHFFPDPGPLRFVCLTIKCSQMFLFYYHL